MLFGARKLEKAKPFKPNFLTSYGELIGSADFWIAAAVTAMFARRDNPIKSWKLEQSRVALVA